MSGIALLLGVTAAGQQSNPAQTDPPRQPSAATLASAIPAYLDKCKCGDAQRLKDRLEKLKGAGLLVIKQLQSTSASKGASRPEWNALQSQINGYLRAMQIQNLTSFPDDSLFLGNNDPFCGPQTVDAGECLNQDFAVHQLGHDASCHAGNWAWQNAWLEKDMWMEEGNAIETEMNIIKETINRMGGCVTTHACPQFGIVVQNVTTSSFSIPGAMTGGSARSLNNGQGVTIPLTFHQDGTFEGHGLGMDAGAARGATPNEAVGGTFGHAQDIAASGYIRAGNCGVQACDVMHLVLTGGPNQQVTQMQARGQINRDLNATTPTNGATVEFDLPAYVGGSAQKTFFSTPVLNSYMTVNLVQGNNGTPGLPAGSSMLYAMQQCKFGAAAPSGGGGGVVVIPGLEIPAGPPKTPVGTVPKRGTLGVEIPGLEGKVPTTGGQPPRISSAAGGTVGILIPGLENNVSNGAVQPATLTVKLNESLSASDTLLPPNPHLVIAVKEPAQILDANSQPSSHVGVRVTESFQTSDAITSPQAPSYVPVNVNESVHVSDDLPPTGNVALSPANITVNESIGVTDGLQ